MVSSDLVFLTFINIVIIRSDSRIEHRTSHLWNRSAIRSPVDISENLSLPRTVDLIDDVLDSTPDEYRNAYLEPLTTGRKSENYSKLKIGIFYVGNMEQNIKDWFFNAVSFWSDALLVKPLNSLIRMGRRCSSLGKYISLDGGKTYDYYCADSCVDETYCGTAEVPDDFLIECKFCRDLDDVRTCRTSGQRGKSTTGLDLLLFLSEGAPQKCLGTVIAYAGNCAKDPATDRPLIGSVNICPRKYYAHDMEKVITILRHEVMHALGFSQKHYGYYRDPNGNPLTSRNKFGEPLNHVNTFGQNVSFSEKVVRSIYRDWAVRSGRVKHRVDLIVTPNVVREVQAHFNCTRLEGAELENYAVPKHYQAGNHWEARVFQDDLMIPYSQQGRYQGASRIDLALLQDTGWYQVNYSKAEPLNYGRNLGCDFCMKSCKEWMDIRRSLHQSISPFCNITKELSFGKYCTDDLSAVGQCSLVNYKKKQITELPAEYQYFDRLEGVPDKSIGFYGGMQYPDYCPIFVPIMYTDKSSDKPLSSECDMESNQPEKFANYALESFGEASVCFLGVKNWKTMNYNSVCKNYDNETHSQWAGCHNVSCENDLLHILVAQHKYPCFYESQVLNVQIFESERLRIGTIVCRKCEEICSKCKTATKTDADKYQYPKEDECVNAIFQDDYLNHTNSASITNIASATGIDITMVTTSMVSHRKESTNIKSATEVNIIKGTTSVVSSTRIESTTGTCPNVAPSLGHSFILGLIAISLNLS